MRSRTQRPGIVRTAVLALTVVLVALALGAGRRESDPVPVPVVGQPSPQDYVADAAISVIDNSATEVARLVERNNVETLFREDTQRTNTVLADLETFFARAKAAQAPLPPEITTTTSTTAPEDTTAEGAPDATVETTEPTTTTTTVPPPADIETQITRLTADYPFLDASTIDTMLGILNGDSVRLENGEEPLFDRIQAETIDLAGGLLDAGITADDLGALKRELLSAPPRLNVPGLEAADRDLAERSVADLVTNLLQSNKQVDEAATETAQDEAAAAVPDVTVPFVMGQVIVRQGDPVSPVALDAINLMGLVEPIEVPRLLALSAVAALAVLLSSFFLFRNSPDVWRNPKLVALFGLLLVLAALAVRIPEVISTDRPELGYLVPAAAFGYLAAILFNPRTALLMAIPLGAFAGLATGHTDLAVFAATATVAPVPFVSAASSRTRLRLAVAYTGLVLAPLAGALAWFFWDAEVAWRAAGAGLVGGVASGVIALGFLPFLETMFRITTTLTLLDLTDRNHPALRLLEENAPGSFNHSILVGTLAGKAARAIGASPLLAQAAAYYHDLGKVTNPQFFIENQFGVSNPHDEMSPLESAETIRRHVTEGLKLARQYRLPLEVSDGIRMHHGTSIMRYFYHKALESDPGADPEAFRHHGARPVRKEIAILMLSDAIEGATRSLVQHEDPSSDSIAKLVDQIVAEKLEDGQLDESSLTFGELTKVKQALVDALIGYYHTRVPYPGFPGAS